MHSCKMILKYTMEVIDYLREGGTKDKLCLQWQRREAGRTHLNIMMRRRNRNTILNPLVLMRLRTIGNATIHSGPRKLF